MLGFTVLSRPTIPFLIRSNPHPFKSTSNSIHRYSRVPGESTVKAEKRNGNGNGNGNGKGTDGEEKMSENEGREEWKKDKGGVLSVKWRDLLDPDPENILAIGLSGLLTWASVQVLWQLFFISFAILVAALKYSFIAALLLFILITLL